MKSETTLESFYFDDESSIEQPTQKHIESLCRHLNLPFNREIAIAIIYGDNQVSVDRVLPIWLNELR